MEKIGDTAIRNRLLVPKFQAEKNTWKQGKLKTDILRINCAEENAQYLKYLLSTASASGDIKKGLFIPTDIHLRKVKKY